MNDGSTIKGAGQNYWSLDEPTAAGGMLLWLNVYREGSSIYEANIVGVHLQLSKSEIHRLIAGS
jgi:hypothetical protein